MRAQYTFKLFLTYFAVLLKVLEGGSANAAESVPQEVVAAAANGSPQVRTGKFCVALISDAVMTGQNLSCPDNFIFYFRR